MTEPGKSQDRLKVISEKLLNMLLIRNPNKVTYIITACLRIRECRNRRIRGEPKLP